MNWLKNNAFWIAVPMLLALLWFAYYTSSRDASLKGSFEGTLFLWLAIPLTIVFIVAVITAFRRKK